MLGTVSIFGGVQSGVMIADFFVSKSCSSSVPLVDFEDSGFSLLGDPCES